MIEEEDYKKLGFRCGIEIHQQLNTKKLFCRCPSEIREDEPDIIVEHRMRAVAGEIGDIDPAALHEFLRDKRIRYQAYSDTTCLVELDEEPPHKLNEEALDAALEVVFLLKAKPIDEIEIMRKTVIDGSNTSGFQRTMLIALDGFVETEEGKVGVPTICLEEDAARKISEEENTIVYRVDRLGIPLIELGTNPEIKSPTHARKVAEKLGMILRATGKVKRGLGTIRQDLNVSIAGGQRIEIKGVQELKLIEGVLKKEVERQIMLNKIKSELQQRGAKEEDIKEDFIDVSSVFKETKSNVIASIIQKSGIVLAVRLPKFRGLLKNRLGPELAQYAKAGAGVRGIFHSDELPAYGITIEEKKALEEMLSLKEEDAFALVAEKKEAAEKALKEVVMRCRLAFHGTPKETRKANPDGSTEFMRPLPGSARMYPETDEPPIVITEERINKIKKNLPELPEMRLQRYVNMGIGAELASQLMKSRFSEEFDELTKKLPTLKASLIATTLLSTPKEIKKKYCIEVEHLETKHFWDALNAVAEKKITKEALLEVLAELAKNPRKSTEEVIKEKGLKKLTPEEIQLVVNEVIAENRNLPEDALLGKTMVKLRGKADAEDVIETIRKSIR